MEETKVRNPVKAIRAKCLDCCCGQTKEVTLCSNVNCALYPFRFGKNPYRSKREYTDEQRLELLTAFDKAAAALLQLGMSRAELAARLEKEGTDHA